MLNPEDFWPDKKPSVPSDSFGWLSDCVADHLKECIQNDMQLILELGAFLGKSTRFLCDNAPNARVITIDTWQGSPEHQGDSRLKTLYDTFIVNCWSYKDRLIPIQNNTIDGMRVVYEAGEVPDMIFIDADHTYEAVCKDIETALYFWPNIKIVGDDWHYGENETPAFPVRKAAQDMADKFNKKLYGFSNVWSYSEYD